MHPGLHQGCVQEFAWNAHGMYTVTTQGMHEACVQECARGVLRNVEGNLVSLKHGSCTAHCRFLARSLEHAVQAAMLQANMV